MEPREPFTDGLQEAVAAPSPADTEIARTAGPFAPVVRHYPRGHVVPWHAHPWPQLCYASSGVIGVETSKGSWIVPPQQAVWLPPNIRHETRMLTDVELSSLYLKETAEWSLDCEVMEISPLLRELILVAMQLDADAILAERERLVVQLIVEELRRAPLGSSPIPMPTTPRLVSFCREVIANPTVEISLEHRAASAGMTSKTAARMFQRDLGMSFRDWRQRVHVSYAIAHLAQGEPVKVVASALGYTPSAFAVMIRRSTGRNPGSLLAGS